MSFEIRVKDNKQRQIRAARLMSAQVLAGIGAMLFLLQPGFRVWSVVLFAAGVGLLVYTLKNKGKANGPSLGIRIGETALTASFIIFAITAGFFIPAIIAGVSLISILFALMLERKGQVYSTVKVTEQGIVRPLVMKHNHLQWQEVDQVLLRFGTLTINCDGNRFYQYPIDRYDFDAKDFETFCQHRIEEGKSKRSTIKNDW